MRLRDVLGFSSSNYKEQISDPDYTLQEIALNIYKKRRAIVASKVQATGGVLASGVTGGWSLASSAYATRNINVEKRKLKLLEEEWSNRRQPRLPKRRLKDMVIPVIIATATQAFAFTIDLGLANAAAQNEMFPIGHPFSYPYDLDAVGLYYNAVERGTQSIGNWVMDKEDSGDEYDSDDDDDDDEDESDDEEYDSDDSGSSSDAGDSSSNQPSDEDSDASTSSDSDDSDDSEASSDDDY
ncbi:hypothetical protein ONZ45_g13707 [Pleurotus djamor]|nr:hypothetical protein ONZ45_g13707 [Pleurotus djamor]